MTQWMAKSLMVAALTGTLLVSGCGTDDSNDDGGDRSFSGFTSARSIVVNFSDSVITSTYQMLDTEVGELSQALATFQGDQSAANLAALQQQWRDTRAPWEMSEGFLFGPVDTSGFDPALDSWPVNRTDLDAVLGSSDSLTEEYIANLDPALKGFHTAEYLIFGVGGTKDTSSFSARELEYLAGVINDMRTSSQSLYESWSVGVDGEAPYGNVLKTAGESGNSAYPSLESAAEENIRGIIAILDEVANGKIADPFDEKDPELVESQFSYNSLTDFTNNIYSVQNAYLGNNRLTGADGPGLDTYIQSVDAELDTQFQSEISAAIAALGQIRAPFRDAINEPDQEDKITAAQEAIRAAFDTANGRILPLITE